MLLMGRLRRMADIQQASQIELHQSTTNQLFQRIHSSQKLLERCNQVFQLLKMRVVFYFFVATDIELVCQVFHTEVLISQVLVLALYLSLFVVFTTMQIKVNVYFTVCLHSPKSESLICP